MHSSGCVVSLKRQSMTGRSTADREAGEGRGLIQGTLVGLDDEGPVLRRRRPTRVTAALRAHGLTSPAWHRRLRARGRASGPGADFIWGVGVSV